MARVILRRRFTIVHLNRNSLEFVSWKDRKSTVPALRPIYCAKDADAGAKALDELEEDAWGQTYPAIAQIGHEQCSQVIQFFAFPENGRRILYTTYDIEALNSKLRRAVSARGHFPNDDAATKLMYHVLRHAAEDWKQQSREWCEAKIQFAVMFGERFVNG